MCSRFLLLWCLLYSGCLLFLYHWRVDGAGSIFKRQKGTVRVILYYAALGAGYMMVEIYLMQRLVFFLANQTFSNSTVIYEQCL